MGERIRITLAIQRQIVFGVAYVYGTLWIGILCFNINIDCSKYDMKFFKFVNNLKR